MCNFLIHGGFDVRKTFSQVEKSRINMCDVIISHTQKEAKNFLWYIQQVSILTRLHL